MARFLERLLGTRPRVPVTRPVFIVGCGRSGTALLFNLLGAYPELAKTTGHPDGEDQVGWIEHGRTLIAGLSNPRGDSGHVGHHLCLHMDEAMATDEARAAMHAHFSDSVLQGRASLRVLNKCPHLSNKLRYVRALFPDARFLHIVRNPVAMVASWVNVMKAVPDLLMYWPEVEHPCWWVFPTSEATTRKDVLKGDSRWYPGGGLLRFADYWAATNAGVPRQLADTPEQLLTLRYEDLIADTPVVMQRVARFCGLTGTAVQPPQIERERNVRYRDLLTDEDVRAIRERTRAVAESFGYVPAEAAA